MLLEIKSLNRGYQRRRKALWAVNGVDLSIRQGDFVDIIGCSGGGKSTLLNMAARLLMPTSGSIRLNDTELYTLEDKETSELRSTRLGHIPQGLDTLSTLTVFDNVRLPYFLSRLQGDTFGQALSLLDEVGISALADMLPSQLSDGELRRVLVTKAPMDKPGILITGEPTSDLDIETTREIIRLFTRINKNGTTILIITHKLDTLEFGNKALITTLGRLTEGSHLGSL